MRWTPLWLLAVGFTVVSIPCLNHVTFGAELVVSSGPRTPEDEAKAFHLPPGFKAQLVASEPEIHKPINMTFDEQGRLWITDTEEYPFPATSGAKTPDSVKILSDFGPDGHARKIETFADNLNIPVGVLPIATNEAIVYSIPAIWDMKDTTGNGHADQRRVLLSGQAHDDTHGQTGSFIEGFDGWVYAVHGFRNTSHVRGTDGSEIEMNSGNIYRFHRDGSHVQYFTHGQVNPFGLAIDPLGNLLSSDCETKPICLLLRGAYYSSFGKPDDGLGFGPDMINHMYGSTAIAGLIDYVAPEYPQSYHNMMLVGNVVTNKINRAQLERIGSGYRGDDAPDFLDSDDHWFRPVTIKLGPDGALYVADFYNRIIGHYEVDLHHPGRDKQRGRIWRIVYEGKDAKPAPTKPFDLTKASVAELIADLSNSNFTIRMLATNYLADHTGQAAVEPLKAALNAPADTWLKAHGMWVLWRLNALDESLQHRLATDSDAIVREHAMRVLSETIPWNAAQHEMALAGLKDSDPLVRRTAADAVGQHPALDNVRPILDAREQAKIDPFLLHTLRMALRNQLDAPGVAEKLPLPGWSEKDVRDLVDAAQGATAPGAIGLLVHHMAELPDDKPQKLAKLVTHAARYGTNEETDELAKVVSSKFTDNTGLELTLFKALEDGIAQRNGALGESARKWGADLATKLLESPKDDFGGWANTSAAQFPDAGNPWSVQLRASADGDKESPFISSLPLGEPGTGILRSPTFKLPDHLSFYVAGHSGKPAIKNTMKNIVCLRDAQSNEVLALSPAPRNDTARRVEWDLTKFAGKSGYVEIMDSDNGTAYAWIAVGRFDPPVVKVPPETEHALRTAIEIASGLRLTSLADRIATVLGSHTDVSNRVAAAQALGVLEPGKHATALIAALSDVKSSPALRNAAGESLAQVETPAAQNAMVEAIRTAPANSQLALAKSLATTASGADALLTAMANGKASPQLLQDRTLIDRLDIAKPANLDQRVHDLTASLPPKDMTLQRTINERVAHFRSDRKKSPENGAKIFATNCMVCHSIGGQGAHVGPQLDGIGVRGAPRLAEDIIDPSRNVDAAFRYNTYQLDDGQVIAGIPRREEGSTLTVADSTGKEIAIPKSRIKRSVQSTQSLMPSNFSEVIKENDFDDLLAYLLTK